MVSLAWIRIINHTLLPVKNECDTSVVLHKGLMSEMSWTLVWMKASGYFLSFLGHQVISSSVLSKLCCSVWSDVYDLAMIEFLINLLFCSKCKVLYVVLCTYVTALSVFHHNTIRQSHSAIVSLYKWIGIVQSVGIHLLRWLADISF